MSNPSKTSSPVFAPLTSVAFGLTMGFLDVAQSLTPHPLRLASLPVALLAVCATALLMTILHALLWAGVSLVVRRRTDGTLVPFTIGLGAFVAILTTYDVALSPRNLPQLVVAAALVLLAAAAGRHCSYLAARSPRPFRWAGFAGSIPVLAAWGFLFVWFQIYHVTSSTSAPSLLSLALFALAIAGTLFGLLGADGRARRAVVPVLTVLVVAGGALGLGATRPTHGTAQSYRDGHDTGQVILITIDTLRRDALSCYGGDNATPNLDALAENGVVFDNALSAAPWTLPALASIVTGLAPAAHTAVVHGSTLPESLITLAEYLQRDGYHTGAIGYNPYLASSRRMNQGFSSYETYPRPPVARSIASAVLSRVMPRFYLSEASTPDIADMSIQWVTENRERDFFFWSHYFDPHGPWEPPLEYRPALDPPPGMGYRFEGVKEARAGMKAAQPFQRDWLRHLYNGEVRYVDAAVGRFLDALKGLGIYDEALIVVTSDHGEEFWEHGNLGHGQSLYNELLGVPLIVKLPRGAGEVRVPEMVPTQALLATILDLCGVPYESPDPNVSSLRPLIEESAEEFEVRPVFSGALAFYEDQEAVTFDRTKYIRALHSLEEQLYDLQTDPGERDNLIADAPNRAQKARGLLDDHDSLASELRSRFDVLQSENLELDAETIRRLKALGYL